ncbi:MAG: PAS domain-containing protein [Methanobacterium sp.]
MCGGVIFLLYDSIEEAENNSYQIRRHILELEDSLQILKKIDDFPDFFFEGSHQYLWEWDLGTGNCNFSSAYVSMLGYESDEIQSTYDSWIKLMHPDDKESFLKEIIRPRENGDMWFEVEFRLRAFDGVWLWIHSQGVVLKTDNQEKPLQVVAIHKDVTNYKDVYEALVKSERRFKSLIENSLDIVSIIDIHGNVIYTSPSTERVLGYKLEKISKIPIFNLIHPRDVAKLSAKFNELTKISGSVGFCDVRVLHENGSWRKMEAIAQNLLDDPEIQGVVVNSRDVTEKR